MPQLGKGHGSAFPPPIDAANPWFRGRPPQRWWQRLVATVRQRLVWVWQGMPKEDDHA